MSMDDRGVSGTFLVTFGIMTLSSFFVAPWQFSVVISVAFLLALAGWLWVFRR